MDERGGWEEDGNENMRDQVGGNGGREYWERKLELGASLKWGHLCKELGS